MVAWALHAVARRSATALISPRLIAADLGVGTAVLITEHWMR